MAQTGCRASPRWVLNTVVDEVSYPPQTHTLCKCLEKRLLILFKLLLLLTDIVGEGSLEAVEDEPALLPRLDLAAHLHQVALAHLLSEDDVVASVHAVARRLHMRAQVKLLLADGEVACHGAGL